MVVRMCWACEASLIRIFGSSSSELGLAASENSDYFHDRAKYVAPVETCIVMVRFEELYERVGSGASKTIYNCSMTIRSNISFKDQTY